MKKTKIGKELNKQLAKLAVGCRILAMEGHSDVSLGHLSLRDPKGRGLWMKRFFIGLDEVRGAEDFMLIDFDGSVLGGDGQCHAEWPIHTEIMRARPEVNVVGHSHPFYASIVAATLDPVHAIGQEGIHFGGKSPHYQETSDLVNTPELGRNLAATLGDANVVFMKNHGVSFCGDSIAHAVLLGVNLEKACRAQLTLQASGTAWEAVDADEAAQKSVTLAGLSLWENFFQYYRRKLLRHEGDRVGAETLVAMSMSWRRGKPLD